MPTLHYYQLSIPVPKPKPDSFDALAVKRGEAIFNGIALIPPRGKRPSRDGLRGWVSKCLRSGLHDLATRPSSGDETFAAG
jgi:hypothetical protein